VTWTARYPDLTGKAVIVAGDSPAIVAVAHAFAMNGSLLAIVAGDRAIVDGAVSAAEEQGSAVMGMTTDPASASGWQRLASHIEQRLGPIDVAIALGEAATREVIGRALLPDMAARHRGVFVEVGDAVAAAPLAPGLRHRAVEAAGLTDADVAALSLAGATDAINAAALRFSVD
jgi:hypothetical protein